MNAGEPPDETGESEGDEGSTDPDRDAVASDGDAADSQEDADASGGNGDGLDPAQEVEAAVEDVMGPGVLDGEGGSDDGTTADESEDDRDSGDSTSGDHADSRDDVGEPTAPAVDDESPDGEAESPDGEAESPDDDGIDETTAVDAARDLIDGDRSEAATGGDDADGAEAVGEGAERPGEATDDGASTASDDAEESVDGPDTDAEESAAAAAAEATRDADGAQGSAAAGGVTEPVEDVPADVRKYDRFKKIDGGTYDRANEFLRDRTYITAREWAMARLCADFRTETGVEMTKIGENLPELVPFMTDTYTPQAVNQARAAFEEKVRKAGATFLYGAMCDFFTAEELDDVMYEATEVAKFLLEVEGVELSVEEELAAEDHISEVMRDVREHSAALRHDEVTCPECGHEIGADD